MRTTQHLDDQALASAMEHSDGRTKTEVINQAPRQFARTRDRKKLLPLRGKVSWEGDIDVLRKRR